MTKRILIINQFASTPKHSSGAGERFYYIAKFLNEKNWQSCIISGSSNHLFLTPPVTRGLFTTEEFSHTKFVWVKTRAYEATSSFGRVFSMLEFLFKLFLYRIPKNQRPDIVLVSSMSIFPVLFAVFLKWRLRIPFILEIRDIWPMSPIELGNISPKHPFMRLIAWVANIGYRNADQIVSVLPDFGNFLKQNGFKDKTSEWIPNGTQQNRVQTEKKLKRESVEKFIVCYTGALGTANAMEYLIEAAKFLDPKKFEIRILGGGPDKKHLQDLAGTNSNIRFFDKVPKKEVAGFLAEADCCYIGWRNREVYNFGVSANKYNDYMLAEKPILSSSNIPTDPVKLAQCGSQVEAENPQGIADGIATLANMSKAERVTLGKKGRAYLDANNTYELLAAKYLNIITRLVPKK